MRRCIPRECLLTWGDFNMLFSPRDVSASRKFPADAGRDSRFRGNGRTFFYWRSGNGKSDGNGMLFFIGGNGRFFYWENGFLGGDFAASRVPTFSPYFPHSPPLPFPPPLPALPPPLFHSRESGNLFPRMREIPRQRNVDVGGCAGNEDSASR